MALKTGTEGLPQKLMPISGHSFADEVLPCCVCRPAASPELLGICEEVEHPGRRDTPSETGSAPSAPPSARRVRHGGVFCLQGGMAGGRSHSTNCCIGSVRGVRPAAGRTPHIACPRAVKPPTHCNVNAGSDKTCPHCDAHRAFLFLSGNERRGRP